MINNFPIFVLDLVTIFLFIALAAQTYYIYLISHKMGLQNKEISQLKEIVYAVYEASKADSNDHVEYHKVTPSGK